MSNGENAIDRTAVEALYRSYGSVASGGRIQGNVSVAGGVGCGAGPAGDCKGVLVIGVIDRPAPLPQATMLGSMIIPAADLSGGRKVAYDIQGRPRSTSPSPTAGSRRTERQMNRQQASHRRTLLLACCLP